MNGIVNMRLAGGRWDAGTLPGSNETVQRVTEASLEILGIFGTLSRNEKWAPLKGRIQEHWMNAFAGTIAAGTSEIQRNIIAGRGLGLPRG